MSSVAKGNPKTPEPPPPLILYTTTRCDKDGKRQEKRGKSLGEQTTGFLLPRRPVYSVGSPKRWSGWTAPVHPSARVADQGSRVGMSDFGERAQMAPT